jgi:hypothetical protein
LVSAIVRHLAAVASVSPIVAAPFVVALSVGAPAVAP